MHPTNKLISALCAAVLLCGCTSLGSGGDDAGEKIWHVVAVHPDGRFLPVRVVDSAGETIVVKAIETPGNLHVMDFKALHEGRKLPIKVLLSDQQRAPVAAILDDGSTLPLQALDADGRRYDVMGVRRDDNIIHIKAIGPNGEAWGVKSISREGHLLDVKGVKMKKEREEGVVHGVPIHAHVKAIPQVCERSAAELIWHVKAIHPEGRTIDVKAIGERGEILDVKAVEMPGNLHVMDVKALRGDERLPVKVLPGDGEHDPVRAITGNGTVLEVKALLPGGERLDVVAARRSGNILHIKALGPDGALYGIKAISPHGLLHDVKGVKMSKEEVEAVVHGVSVRSHIKALPQVIGSTH